MIDQNRDNSLMLLIIKYKSDWYIIITAHSPATKLFRKIYITEVRSVIKILNCVKTNREK